MEEEVPKKVRNRISNEMIHSCYEIGKELFEEKIGRSDVDSKLEKIGINNASGWDYVNNYRYLVSGRVFVRTMNIYGTEYYLQRIFEEGGEKGLETALRSLMLHINYYEGLNPTKTRCLGKRRVHSKHLARLKK